MTTKPRSGFFGAAAAILDGEETTKQKARSEAAASEAQSKPGSQNS